MQIIVHKDSVTGLVNYKYVEEEPVELSPEEKNKENEFWDDMSESNKKSNQRKHKLQDSFWKLNPDTFKLCWEHLYNDYSQERKKDTDNDKDLEKIETDFKKVFVESFVDSLYEEKNKKLLKKNLVKVLTTWEIEFNPKFLTMLLWQMDFKEQSLKLLETIPSDFSAEVYDYIYDFVADFRKRDLPLNSIDRDNILKEEKSNFLQIQNKYNTLKKISDKLVEKNIKTKHMKI